MDQFLRAVIIFLFFVLLYMLWKTKIQAKNRINVINLPPEIPGAYFPIGHLHLFMGKTPLALILANLADKYGHIFTIRLGIHRAIIVSNWEIVKECFTTNDKVLVGRPASSAGIYLGYNNASFGFADYGPYWRNIRKLVLLEVLSSRRLEQFKCVRVTEVETNIKELYSSILKSSSTSPARVNMSQWFEQLTLNVIMKMITGKRYKTDDEKGRHFTRTTKEYMYESVQFVLSDIIPLPFLKWFDFQGRIKSMKRLSQEMDKIVTNWIDEHLMKRELAKDDDDQDFIDVMLSKIDDQFMYGYTKETIIKATILNIILAGSDTTSIHLTWVLSLLLNNKHVMEQAQEELDMKIGKERWAQEHDIKNLVYLQAIVKETLRLYPPGPLAIPRAAMEDCTIGGYQVPKGTRLMVNVWKLHRDPGIWSDPEKFMPERFLKSHIEFEVSGQNFEFIPFGSGRRSCPGITFAMQVTHLTLARLLQGFNFSTLEDMPVDMSEGNSITLPKANPLEVLRKTGQKGYQSPEKKLLSWVRRQSKKVKIFLGLITAITLLVTLKLAVHDHNYFFVVAEAIHLIGLLVLIYKLTTLKTCSGLSLKTQVLTAIFLAVRLYCSFIMEADIHTVLDLITLAATLWVIYMMKFKLKASYMADLDNMPLYYTIIPAAVLAFFVHPTTSHILINRILWAFCVYLESVSVLPQLRLMQNVQIIEPFSAHYVFALGVARFLGCAHWVIQVYDTAGAYIYLAGRGYFWIPMVFLAEIVQTFILADFCYYYVKSVMSGQLIVRLPTPV